MSARHTAETRWGAQLDENGGAHFRLWAPGLRELRLRLQGGEERAMDPLGDGWFELVANGVRHGASYQFVLPDGLAVPDPAARAQASDVHGTSLLVDPRGFEWQATGWRGRPLEEAVIYELHAGSFSPEGDFDGIRRRLDHLADTGFTAIELMPVAQFSGNRGWGYDGVLLYCPHAAYGGVDGLKRLVDAAHQRGLMMFLDVVYNHFGPDGNYLGAYAPEFFDPERHTPWGPGIRFEEQAVRDFFTDNPIYWLEEFQFDGLRFDAVDQIKDASCPSILEEMARRIRARFPDRHIHLMTEDERNIIALHPRDAGNRPVLFSAEWNDDLHHAAHCIATGEAAGYYAPFADEPVAHLARALAEGFCYQGEAYAPWDGKARGVPSSSQPPLAFVNFLQNHDQIGNRALGERLTALADAQTLELLTAMLLLNPQIPLVFMGEEYGETQPFLFFTDIHGELAKAVRDGRRREFAAFAQYAAEEAARIPDPNALSTFEASSLDWSRAETEPGSRRLKLLRRLIALRQRHIAPRLAQMKSMQGRMRQRGRMAFTVEWSLDDGARLSMRANFGEDDENAETSVDDLELIHESRSGVFDSLRDGSLPARSVAVLIAERRG